MTMLIVFLQAILCLYFVQISTCDLSRANIIDVLDTIDRHNRNPNKTFFLRFSDVSMLSPKEYKQRLGARLPSAMPNSTRFENPKAIEAPESIDWRVRGAVSRVKSQGNCGSCWAFAAVGSLEGQHGIRTGKLEEFSEQNLVDCADESYGNARCMGGWLTAAFEYIRTNDGIDTEESYPYVAHNQSCRFKRDSVGETIHGYNVIPAEDELALKNAVAAIGPIAVLIDAGHPSFQHYGGGVYSEEQCRSGWGLLNHAVLVVGYGTDPVGGDYWLVKNSWDIRWGEEGYIRMARNRGNQCGIATAAAYPIL